MARNRMIKPEFWEDSRVAKCSFEARLLFIATWNFADDEGYLPCDYEWLKIKCFPYDNFDIKKLIQELVKNDLLQIRGEIIFIKNFQKHQYINRPRPSGLSEKFNNSVNNHGIVTEPSDTKREYENEYEIENESERECRGDESPTTLTPKETMKDFVAMVLKKPDKYYLFVQQIAQGKQLPPEIVRAQIDAFVNHWTELNKSGKKQKWELQQTFEVQKRLGTWFSNAEKWGKLDSLSIPSI